MGGARTKPVKILSFGSMNLDYVYSVDHFVRAGETIACEKLEIFCGGKGLNQSIALSRAGAEVFHAGAVGENGGVLVDILEKNGVDTSGVRQVGAPTGHAIIQRKKDGQNCILVYGGANREISDDHIDAALSGFGEGDYLMLQNEIGQMPEIMRKAKRRGMKIVLNPSPASDSVLKLPLELADIFMLNEVEGAFLSGSGHPESMLKNLAEKYPRAAFVLTLGEFGAMYHEKGLPEPLSHGSYAVEVVDTVAAGDTFAGFFTACIIKGETVPRALELASKAAALAVSRPGAQPSIPTLEDVLSAKLTLSRK